MDSTEIEQERKAKQMAVDQANMQLASAKATLVQVRSIALDLASEPADAAASTINDEKKKLLAIDPAYDPSAANGVTAAVDRASKAVSDATAQVKAAKDAQAAFESEVTTLEQGSRSFGARFALARKARCATAYCFGPTDGTDYAFEPLLELPVGTTLAFGDGALARFNNATQISIQFSAGLRFWMFHDMVSIGVYFAQPIYSGDSKVHLEGSPVDYPTTAIRRIGPSGAIGLFGDLLFIGFGWDELRNGSSGSARDPNYAPSQVLSRSLTFQLGIAPFTAVRNVAGGLGVH
jgi:hypothetical protein